MMEQPTDPAPSARHPALDISDRDVLNALPRAVVVTDPAGRIVLWNRPAEVLYGWMEAEVLGCPIIDVLAPTDAVVENAADFARVSDGAVARGDRLVRRRDGTVLRVLTHTQPVRDASGHVIAIVGTAEDIEAIRAAEQRARDVTAHFRAALDAGGLGTWRWDLGTGVIVWDERLEALFGLPDGGFDGSFDTYVSMLHPDDRAGVIAAVEKAVRTKTQYRTEHRVVWPDGTVHWLSGAGDVTTDDVGVVTGTVGCVLDVSEQVAESQERERLTAAVLAAHEQERVQRERLEFLAAINDALNISASRREVMQRVTCTAVPRLGDWCSIHVLPTLTALVPEVEIAHSDPAMVAHAKELRARFRKDPNALTGVARVIRTGATQFYPELTDEVLTALDATENDRAIIAELGIGSSIAVPLIKHGNVLGAIQFVRSSASRPYTSDDVALAHTVAGRIASSLENHRLHEEQRVIATTLQRSLLPATLPPIPHLDVAVRYWAAGEANEVGGDFYDIFALDRDDQWALMIGDVCGTGPAAAAMTGLARHTIRAGAWHGDTPIEILTTLNRAVQRSETDSFLTVAYAIITAGATTELTLANAGHPLPVIVTGDSVGTVGNPGTLVGMLDAVVVNPATVTLRDGDVIVFYTDGATDVPRHSLDERQWNALVATAARGATSADAIADNIRDSLEAVLPFERRNDDIALLILRVVGSADPNTVGHEPHPE